MTSDADDDLDDPTMSPMLRAVLAEGRRIDAARAKAKLTQARNEAILATAPDSPEAKAILERRAKFLVRRAKEKAAKQAANAARLEGFHRAIDDADKIEMKPLVTKHFTLPAFDPKEHADY